MATKDEELCSRVVFLCREWRGLWPSGLMGTEGGRGGGEGGGGRGGGGRRRQVEFTI